MDGCNGRIRPMSDTTLRDQLAKLIVNRDEFDGADATAVAWASTLRED